MTEEDVVKRGYLTESGIKSLLRGKRWFVLRRDSRYGRMRLDYYKTERSARSGELPQGFIPLQDALSVEIRQESNGTFQILATQGSARAFSCSSITDAEEWVSALRALIFGNDLPRPPPRPSDMFMSRGNRCRFRVTPQDCDRLGIRSTCLYEMEVTDDEIQLSELSTGNRLQTWPINAIRRYGRNDSCFTFEAGRRCRTGEGFFTFLTTGQDSEQLYQKVHANSQEIARRARASTMPTPLQARNYADPHDFERQQQEEAQRTSTLPAVFATPGTPSQPTEAVAYASLSQGTRLPDSQYQPLNATNNRSQTFTNSSGVGLHRKVQNVDRASVNADFPVQPSYLDFGDAEVRAPRPVSPSPGHAS